MATFEWDKTKADAMKILGKDGDVPDKPATIDKALTDFGKAYEKFKKSSEGIEKDILALENSNDEIKNALKQFQATISKSDLGLDPKKKEDAKKIQQARKILMDRITVGMKRHDTNEKDFDELDKHVIQLGKYKPGTP
jgi:predicted  nucleic acid-binding Zn-ribbon protein